MGKAAKKTAKSKPTKAKVVSKKAPAPVKKAEKKSEKPAAVVSTSFPKIKTSSQQKLLTAEGWKRLLMQSAAKKK